MEPIELTDEMIREYCLYSNVFYLEKLFENAMQTYPDLIRLTLEDFNGDFEEWLEDCFGKGRVRW